MRALLGLALAVFLAALGVAAVSGGQAARDAREAQAQLDARRSALEALMDTAAPVPWSVLAAAEARLGEASRELDSRLSQLLDPPGAGSTADLPTLLARTSVRGLQAGGNLRTQITDLAAAAPDLPDVLALIVAALDEAGVYELQELRAGDLGPWEGLPGVLSRRMELVLLAELPAALTLVELLAPRPASPLPSLASVSLRRVPPGLWPDQPAGLSSPPIQAWLTLDAAAGPRSDAR